MKIKEKVLKEMRCPKCNEAFLTEKQDEVRKPKIKRGKR